MSEFASKPGTPALTKSEFEASVLPIFEIFPDSICILDSDAHITRVNRAFTRLMGYTEEEIRGRSIELVVPDHLRDEFLRHKKNVLQGDEIGRETVRQARDGTLIDVLVRGLPIELADGSRMILVIYTDIRERIEAETRLLQARDRAQRYLDTAGVMLLALDRAGTITLINNKGCEILGCPEEEILGRNWFQSFLPEDQKDHVARVFRDLTSEPGGSFRHNVNPIVTGSGEIRLISWYNTIYLDEAGEFTGTLSSGEDITEKRQLEEQLFNARQLESTGRLAGAVAHDFNNLLMIISGTAEILTLTGGIPEGSIEAERISRISEAAGRAKVLIEKLTSYGRQQLLRPKIFDLNTVVIALDKLLRQTLREDIEISISPAGDPAWLEVDPMHMERVILDLAINAGESMPSGGTLSIIIETVDLEADRIASERLMLQPGRYVVLSMIDTGEPISPEDLPLIFEPRLATRDVGRGSGYILPGVYGYVKQSGGEMSVSSGPERGTTFRIWFAEQQPETTPLPVVEEDTASTGSTDGTILVVDDEAEIREMMTTILEAIGYRVIPAASGQAALEIVEREAVDLLITDAVMPGMGGAELASRIADRGIPLKTIFVSGYPGEEIIEQEGLSPDSIFLQKPFTVSALTSLVQKHL